MKIKDKIRTAIQKEIEPLGFHYVKSARGFERIIDKNTIVKIVYDADCFHPGFTDITLLSAAYYLDIEEVLYKLTDMTVNEEGHLGIICRLQWLIPEEESANLDFCFRDSDNEETYYYKLHNLLWRMKTYTLEHINRLSQKDTAIKEAIWLDSKDLILAEGVVPVMYCIWKHDKKAALDYLEEKRLRLLGRVKPEEWELLERFKNGERFGKHNPLNANIYDEYMTFSARFKEWVEE